MTNVVPITRKDLGLFLMALVSYALGRMTYIVFEACELTRKYWKEIDANDRVVITRDVLEALERSARLSKPLGMDFDHEQWVALLKWIREQQ